MIPLRDDVPARRFALVTYAIIAVNVLVFWHELTLGHRLGRFVDTFGLVPERFHLARHPLARLVPLYTSMFVHGGLLHLAGNMLFLHIFGDNVEDRLGHFRFLCFYLGCGTIAALLQVGMLAHSTVPVVGASGAIAGVTGAYFVFFPRARVLLLVPVFVFLEIVQVPAVVFLFVWFVIQLAFGMNVIHAGGTEMAGVAWWAHVGGFGGGVVGGPLLAPRPRRR